VLALTAGLVLATMVERVIRGRGLYRTLLIWPYAIAPAIAGILWLFMFSDQLGTFAYLLNDIGVRWDPLLNQAHAMILIVAAAAWKQVSYNFLFFVAGLQAIPKSLIEAAAIDGARPFKRFRTIIFPLLGPTTFFLLVVNTVYAFFDTFGIVDAVTAGGPQHATSTLVYKVYRDGYVNLQPGLSSAESVILMVIVVVLTSVQFRTVERRVHYA
jgi:sn-glycerol 3-phosphate transport system permease protein